MSVSHVPWLVALSIVVAIQGAYVGLSLVLRLPGAGRVLRKRLLAGGALSLAVAIWSMHFVGMLAIRESERIAFLMVPTFVSFLVCVFVVGLAIYIASTDPKSESILTLAGTLMGVGIVTMHFIGMLALHGNMTVEHDPRFVIAAVVVGVLASNLAIRLAFASTPPPLAAASIALGLAISGMHYMAMAGTMLSSATVDPDAVMLSHDVLAVIVSLTAFLISGFFFLTLLPEPTGAGSVDYQSLETEHAALPKSASGGALVDETLKSTDYASVASHSADRAAASALPVLKEGATIYLPVGQVVAIRADAHYTSVFDGSESYFCSLSISDIETRLDPQLFMRVHRSHIVSIHKVASIKRSGDGGIARLSGDVPYSSPISRRKLSELKARLQG